MNAPSLRALALLCGCLLLAAAARAADNPRLVSQAAHAKTVTAIAIDPSGRWMASGGEDGTIGLWDLRTGYRLQTMTGHTAAVGALRFGSGHGGIALYSMGLIDSDLVAWTISPSGQAQSGRRDLRWLGYPDAFDVAPGAGLASVAAGIDGLEVWTDDGADTPVRLRLPGALLTDVAISPDGQSVVTLSQAGELTRWDLRNRSAPASTVLYAADHGVELYRFTPAGALFVVRHVRAGVARDASGARPRLVFDAWAARGTAPLSSHTVYGECLLTPLAIADDGKLAAIAGAISIFRRGAFKSTPDPGCAAPGVALLRPGAPTAATLLDADPNDLAVAAFDATAATLALGYRNGNIARLKLAHRDGGSAVLAADTLGTGGLAPVSGVALLDRGKTLAVSSGRQLNLWDMRSGYRRASATAERDIGALAGHPSANVLAVAEEDGRVSLRDSDGTVLYSRAFAARDPKLALSKDGNKLAVGFNSPLLESGTSLLSLIEFGGSAEAREAVVRDFPKALRSVRALAFNDAATLMASGHLQHTDDPDPGPTLRLWDTRSLDERRTLFAGDQASVLSLDFQPRRDVLGIGSAEGMLGENKNFLLYDIAANRVGATDVDAGINGALAISPDGALAVLGSQIRQAAAAPAPASAAPRALPGYTDRPGNAPTLGLWDTASGRRLAGLAGHGAGVNALVFNGDRQVLSASEDGTVLLWQLPAAPAPGGPDIDAAATMLHFRDPGAWLIAAADGRFDTDDLERIKSFAWVFPDDPLRAFPAEIFMRDFYTPGLLGRLANGCPDGPCAVPAAATITALNRVQPQVAITAVRPGARPDEVFVEVSATGRHDPSQRNGKQYSGAYDLRLFRNGHLVGQRPAPRADGAQGLDAWRAGSRLVAGDGRASKHGFKVKLPSMAGAKPIALSAYAFNEDRVKSETANWERFTAPTKAPGRKPRAYIIAMGVDTSGGQLRDLAYAVKDARDIRAALSRIDGYDVVGLTLLSGAGARGPLRQATKSNLRDVLELLAGKTGSQRARLEQAGGIDRHALARLQKASPDDIVILSFSGHGYAADSGRLYLIPSGARPQVPFVPADLPNFISSEDLSAWLRDVDAGQLAMIIDACHAAAGVEGEGFKPGPLGDGGLGQLAYDKGMLILAATQASDVALEVQQMRQGLLTYALTGLGLLTSSEHPGRRAADLDGNGRLTLAEWLRFAEQQVPRLYAAIRGDQLPALRRDVLPVSATWRDDVAREGQKPTLFDFRKEADDIVIAGSGR